MTSSLTSAHSDSTYPTPVLPNSLNTFFPSIVDIAGEAIITINRDQQILLFNRAAVETFGFQVDEVIGQSLDILLPERFTNLHHGFINGFISAPTVARYMHQRQQIRCLRKDGTEFPAEASISKVKHGDEVFLTVILRDVSEREKIEEELRNALNTEKEMSQLKSRLISIISHELRTPLAIIQSSSELLERYEDKMSLERKQECFQHITEQVRQLSDLIEDTLTVTRAENVGLRYAPQMDDLERFCYSIVNKFELTNDRSHQIIFVAHEASHKVLFDKKLLWQALNNLLSNAIKYSLKGGTIYFDLIFDPEQIRILVRDEGIGIPEKDQKHLFEDFHRASNVSHLPGTGLGLAIAHQAVQAHGGTLTFESREGVGTTFTITLPHMSAANES